jgi:hypothetical protein
MSKVKYRIGIDSDLHESGYCLIRHVPFGKQEIVELGTKPFFEIINFINATHQRAEQEGATLLVCIESGWLNKSSSHHYAKNTAIAARIGANVGANHTIGQKFVEYCEMHKIPYKLFKPSSSKWDANIFKKITGWQGRTNGETRDAVRAAWL